MQSLLRSFPRATIFSSVLLFQKKHYINFHVFDLSEEQVIEPFLLVFSMLVVIIILSSTLSSSDQDEWESSS